MVLTLDRYVSHLQGAVLQVFDDHNTLIVKEEGGISKPCQECDKDMPLSNYYHHHNFLNYTRKGINMIDHFSLMIIPHLWYISHNNQTYL